MRFAWVWSRPSRKSVAPTYALLSQLMCGVDAAGRPRYSYRHMSKADFTCPVCGAEVPATVKACPDCGADEKTGWSDETIYDGTGIEDPVDFDYADWQRREGVGKGTGNRRQLVIWAVAALMLGLMLFLLLR